MFGNTMMRTVLFLFTFMLYHISWCQLETITDQLSVNKGKLNAYIYSPPTKTNIKKPLVIVLHGCNQNANDISEGAGWFDMANYYDFYVLLPEQRRSNNMMRCFSWYLDADTEKDKGAIASIHEMVQFTTSHYPIDNSQIFIYGVSAGAMMAVNYMAAYPDQLKSSAIIAGGSYKQIKNPLNVFSEMKNPTGVDNETLRKRLYSQNPDYKGSFPQLIVMHGTNDKVVHHSNSQLLIQQWKTTCEIEKVEQVELHPNKSIPRVTKSMYLNKENVPQIIYYNIENWGHYLMIDPGPPPTQGGTINKYSVDANFFSTYEIIQDWQLNLATD